MKAKNTAVFHLSPQQTTQKEKQVSLHVYSMIVNTYYGKVTLDI